MSVGLDKWLGQRSIRFKLTAAFSLVISGIVLFQVLYFPVRQSQQAMGALSAKGRSLARLLTSALGPSFATGDRLAAAEVLRTAASDPDLAYLLLLNADGSRIAAHNAEQAPTFGVHDRAMFDPGAGGLREERSGDRIVVFATVSAGDDQKRPPGVLVAGFTTESIRLERWANQSAAVAIGIACLAAGLALTVLITRNLGKRLERLGALAETVERGELKRAVIDAQGLEAADEIGEMSRGYVTMVRSLDELAARAQAVAEGDLSITLESRGELADAFRSMLGSLRRLVGEIGTSSHKIDVTLSGVVAAARQQENAATEQASAIEETRITMDSLLESSRSIAKSSELVLSNAEMTLRNNKLVAERYAQLSAQVQRITEILELIKDIANKSDLLALNAALEGTKAGEAGRGFSLVAAQMQRLAENVMASVQDIKKLVADIREASQAAVLATEEGTKLADATTEMARQIRLITQQQQTGTEQVTQSMDEAAGQLAQTVSGIKQMTDSMQSLTALAGRLTELVRSFRLA
jgi:methyl-accepting chemotaxis protein